ncbi:hypothetical protein BCY89_24145 [Sphingobacterium siyangense]|jgi:hypothetical protein|uniref:Uncharacterized protein n=1 Tax=Sphingobacterium siyangense TaxID=459529 RepID=A0A420G2R7_9SPHI|nr:hypothetical protein [Sphingobacterium siyangense]RKF39516.1 hypothetical protein BCY89_24145 [Sphingobacterium siyangense]
MERRQDYIERQLSKFGEALFLKFGDLKCVNEGMDQNFFATLKEILSLDLLKSSVSEELLDVYLEKSLINRSDILDIIKFSLASVYKNEYDNVLARNVLSMIDFLQKDSENYLVELYFIKSRINELLAQSNNTLK